MPPLLQKPAGTHWLTDTVAWRLDTSPTSLAAFCPSAATLTGVARCAALVAATAMKDAMGPICRKRMLVKCKPGHARGGGSREEDEEDVDELAGDNGQEDEGKERQPLPRSAVNVSAAAATLMERTAIPWKVQPRQPLARM